MNGSTLMRRLLIPLLLMVCAGSGWAADPWTTAAQNADPANQAFVRANRSMHAWYNTQLGKNNFLLPRQRTERIWNTKDCAADMFCWFAVTAYLTDQAFFETSIKQTLLDEI